tara:strand:+ start:293 stop:583 length:291 start_codon:yes stop_codon:yes gene_type:complete
MKRLLLPLIASLALPTAVNAETWYLMAHLSHRGEGTTNWSIPTNSLKECEEAGQRFLDLNNHSGNKTMQKIFKKKGAGFTTQAEALWRSYVCVKGK